MFNDTLLRFAVLFSRVKEKVQVDDSREVCEALQEDSYFQEPAKGTEKMRDSLIRSKTFAQFAFGNATKVHCH